MTIQAQPKEGGSMLMGVERLVDLAGPRVVGGDSAPEAIGAAVQGRGLVALSAANGHFAAVARDGQTVRLARTIGLPLRYFVAKMF
ncbi:MAG TPA: hypothetical protein VKU60_07510, partial [Chloroflexota bacterium]|nr:hypothetical protein [Chloroflexota bacterium]